MPETRQLSVGLVLMLGLFLAWGTDSDWRSLIIRSESRWIIDLLDEERACAIGHAMGQTLHQLLGPTLSQPQGSFAEGLVMGLRQIFTRIATLTFLWPLLLLAAWGFFHEAGCMRALMAEQFVYTSPLTYRRVRALPLVGCLLAVALLVSPIPLHPLALPACLMLAIGSAAWRHARYMKQI